MVIDFNTGGTNNAARSSQTGAASGKRDVAAEHPSNDAPTASKPAAADSGVKLSNQAQQLQAIEERLRELPEVDNTHIEQIKQTIANNSYQIDSTRIANKLITLEQ